MSKSVIFQIFSEVEMFRKFTKILIAFSITLLILSCCSSNESNFFNDLDITAQTTSAYTDYDLNNIPPYSDSPYVEINNNVPELSEKKKTSTTSFEEYGTLDSLGRCTYAVSCRQKNVAQSARLNRQVGIFQNIALLTENICIIVAI